MRKSRNRWSCSVLALAAACGASEGATSSALEATAVVPAAERAWLERIEVERTQAATDPVHLPRWRGDAVTLGAGRARAQLSASGARVSLGTANVTLRAARWGRVGALEALSTSGSPSISGPEVRTERAPGVVEWWRSLPSGLEHGVTIAERPDGEGELELEIAVSSTLTARERTSGSVELVDASGTRVMSYAHLAVIDADGAQLPAHASVRDGSIVLALDDTHARYPVVIDPMLVVVEEAALHSSTPAAQDWFGGTVALDQDASRALVTAFPFFGTADTTPTAGGSARVFVRTGTSWAEESILSTSSPLLNEVTGFTGALSSDGTRALVSSPNFWLLDGDETDVVRVFARTGTTWTEEAVLSNAEIGRRFGTSVALSADGSRALVGIPGDLIADGPEAGYPGGSARVFARTGTSWAEEATLLPRDRESGSNFGNAVALSADGTRALVAGNYDWLDHPWMGSVRVFVRTGTSWTEEAMLVASDGAYDEFFGSSVALTADATRVVVGAPQDDTPAGRDTGSAHVFVRTGTSWTEEAILVAHDAEDDNLNYRDRFGTSVAIDDAGSTVLVGVLGDDTIAGVDTGSVRVFRRSGTTWTEDSTLLLPDAQPADWLGEIALSGDGTRAIAGVGADDVDGLINAGSARIFTVALELDPDGTACTSAETCTSGYCVSGVCSADPGDAGTDADAGAASEDDAGAAGEDDAGSGADAAVASGDGGGAAEDGGSDAGVFPLSAPVRAECSVAPGRATSGVVPLLSVVALVLSVARGRSRRRARRGRASVEES